MGFVRLATLVALVAVTMAVIFLAVTDQRVLEGVLPDQVYDNLEVLKATTTDTFTSLESGETVMVISGAGSVVLIGAGYRQLPLAEVREGSIARLVNVNQDITVELLGEQITVRRGSVTIFTGTKQTVSTGRVAPAQPAASSSSLMITATTSTSTAGGQTDIEPSSVFEYAWQWKKTVTVSGSVIEPRSGYVFSLEFIPAGVVTGTTDCNNFSGSYQYSPTTSSLGFYSLSSTLRGCEESQESLYLSWLTGAPLRVNLTNDTTLILQASDGTTLEYVRQQPSSE